MGDLADEGRQGKALRRLSRLKLLVPFRVAHPACNFRCLPSHAAGRESNRLREATCFNFSPQRGMRKCGELQYLGFTKVPLDLDSHHMHPASQESKTAARGSAFPATTTNKAMAAMIPRAVSALRIARPSLARRPARPASWKPVIPRQVLRNFLLHAHRRTADAPAVRAPWISSPADGVQTRKPAFASTVLVLAACSLLSLSALPHDLCYAVGICDSYGSGCESC